MERGTVNDTGLDSVQEEIANFLLKQEKPVSTQDIADSLDRPWHSIQTRCLMLQIHGKVAGFRIGRMNLWEIKK
ncbi:MAG: hypothetical protein ACP5OG_05850 [Candidatus Nanoarchaeia archaeon]